MRELNCEVGESVLIGDFVVYILGTDEDEARLAVQGPSDVRIVRAELLEGKNFELPTAIFDR